MKSLAPNTLLQNRYLVVHLIGKGGMGDVYLAVDQRLGSAVALKRTFFADDEMLGGAFEREAKTLARLRHPVLPKVSDHFIENGEQYLVMEHISGDDLSKRLEAAQKPFPLSWVLFWADQLLDSLAYLHAHEPPIIHRDIKPQNLKLTDENSIILLDFGLSKNNTGESRVMSGSTGSIVGYTPHYAPMEQIRGTGTNPRSDLYSLSATLYQLVTNIVPADSLTRADALLNDMSDPVKGINEINPEVSEAVSKVILKGMEISMERRFSAAREMQKALRDAFASMQNAMSAQTIAFNIQSEQGLLPPNEHISQPISASQEKTEVLNIPPSNIPLAIPPVPPILASTSQNQGSGALPGQKAESFDAAARIDSQSENTGFKQSDVKTEVFIAGSIPEIAAVQNQNHFAQENKQSGKVTGESFGENTNKDNSGGYTPEATVPLFNYENQENAAESPVQPGDSMFFTNPNIGQNVGQNADSFATYTPTAANSSTNDNQGQNFNRAEQFNSQPQAQTNAPAKKKSGSKTLAIVGGLGALLILAIAALGGGWYYYTNYYKAGIAENPTPSPSIEFSPTPEPGLQGGGLDSNANSNTNSADSNTADNSNTFGTNTETNSGADNTTITDPTPLGGVPTPQRTATPRPTPQRTATPIKQVTPTPEKTVKPTPPRILQ